jgi:hypothetical protein
MFLYFNPYVFGTTGPGPVIPPGYITQNLVGYWDFGLLSSYYGANALVVNDLSGNGLNMTYSLGGGYYPPPYTSNGYSATVQTGGPSGAGSTANGYLANVAYTQNFSSTGFTFEYSGIPTVMYGTGGFPSFIGFLTGSTPYFLGYNVVSSTNGQIGFYDNGVNKVQSGANAIQIGNEQHYTISSTSSGALSIYINGTLIASGTTTLPSSSTGTLFIGTWNPGSGYGGCVISSMARVYNAPLSSSNVWTNYGNVYQNLTYKTYTPTVPSYKTYITTGLVGYWDFTSSSSYPGTGSTVTDLSSLGNSLGFTGTPSYNSTGALSFNPSSTSYLKSSAVALNLSTGFTIESLVYLTSTTGTHCVLSYSTSAGTNYVAQTVLNGFLNGGGGGSYSGSFGTGISLTIGQWYHLVSVFTSTTATTCLHYVNGVSIGIGSTTDFTAFPNNPASTLVYMGALSDTTTIAFTGKIALGRIYNTALTAAQVQENYVSAFSKLTGTVPYVMTGLLGYWDLADSRSSSLSGSALNDLGPVGTNLSISGTPSYNSTGALSYNPSSSSYASSSAVALNFTSGLTVECLVYFTSLSTTPNTLSYGSSISSYFEQEIQTNGALYFQISGFSSYTGQMYTAASTITTGQWYHIVSVVPSPTSAYTACSHYVNGVSIPITGGVNWTGLPNNPASTQLYLGNNSWVSGQYVNGKVAMGRIYGIPLSASQVRQNYSAAFSKLNSNPYNLSPPLNLDLFFPPIPLTSTPMYMNAQSYGNGQYITNASSIYNSTYASYVVTNTSGGWWATPVGLYNTSSPFNCTSGKSLGGVSGEWVTVQLPVPLLLNSYSFGWQASLLESPNIWSLLGSNDGSTWTILDSNRNYTFTTSPQQVLFTPSTITTSYTTFGIVVTNVQGNSSGQLGFAFLKFYGTPVSSLAVPPGLPYWTSSAQYTTTNLIGYWDFALTPSSSLSGVNLFDLSGLGSNILFPSAPTYVTSPPSYTSTTTSYANNYLTINYSTGGFTYECLFYLTSLPATNGYLLNHWTNGYSTGSFGLGVTSTGAIGIITSGNVTGNYQTGTGIITTGKWYHVVVVNNAVAIYLNGVSQTIVTNVAQTGFPGSAYQPFYIGNQYNNTSLGIQGNIAMARVYQTTSLTLSQVFANYAHCVNKVSGNPYSLPIYTVLLLHCDTSSFIDSSTYNDTTSVSGTNPFSANGIFGSSGCFNYAAVNSLVKAASSSNFTIGSKNFCIEYWINTSSASWGTGNYVLMTSYDSSTNPTNCWALLNSGGAFIFQVSGSSNYAVFTLSGNASVSGVWNHFALTRNGTNITVYVNGVSKATGTISGSIDGGTSYPISIGNNSYPFSSSSYLVTAPTTFYIDEIRVSVGTSMYNANFTPPTAPFPI